ncbi:ATP-binding protein [Streptomyces longisporoflavus]|uniref:ATP-binding protein n=1 Tax=Streptomyces longisporoflavus TaxID=28044 RepID=A0ABW7QMR4_9ACTN
MAGQCEGQRLFGQAIFSSHVFQGSEPISAARDAAREFVTGVQAVRGVPVSARVMDVVQLVVSELVTNAYKHAPGPCLLDLEADGGSVEIRVWDAGTTLPTIHPPDSKRIGQHGLEIVTCVCRSLEMRREPVGKRITAVIALADDANGHPAGSAM